MMLKETLRPYSHETASARAAYYAGNMYKIKTSQARVISITSGKGGVGKTNVVANLAYALAQLGKKILVVDADLGLANIDILLGLTPKYNLQHVIMGQKRLAEVIVTGPGGIKILPASSGVEELTSLTMGQRKRLLAEFSLLDEAYDFVINVVEPDPTSFTDAYALMKVLSVKYGANNFKALINNVASEAEAKDIFEKLRLVTDKFLQIKLEYLGHILRDDKLREAVRLQHAVTEIYPYAKSSRCFYQIVKNLCNVPKGEIKENSINRFINRLLGKGD